MEPIKLEETLALYREEFIARFQQWIKEFNNNELLNVNVWNKDTEKWEADPLTCPLHFWVVHNKAKCKNETVPDTLLCPLCGHPCCPSCMNHKVDQLSRVTGYLAPVSGWGAAKKQEFEDRKRHEISR